MGFAVGFGHEVQLSPVAGAQLYVPPPVPFSTVLLPVVMGTKEPASATGVGFTVITVVEVLLPKLFEETSVTVYVPGVLQHTEPGFCNVDVAGVPFGKVHVQVSGRPVLLSEKLMQLPSQIVVCDAAMAALGAAQACTTTITLSVFVQPFASVMVT